MGHLQIQASAIARVQGNEIKIDFSGMSLRQLVAMRRLGMGMNAKSCDSWVEAATAAVRALYEYMDMDLSPALSIDLEGFVIKVQVERNVEEAYRQVVNFFARENITVEKPSGVRGFAPA